MSLWTPSGSSAPVQSSMEITSQFIELYDSDLLAIEQGPLKWANKWAGTRRDIDRFVKDLTEQFNHIGLDVKVSVHMMGDEDGNPIEGVYGFGVEIQGRTDRSHQFDYDRMVHEVTNNLLELPGEEKGFVVKTDRAMLDAERARREGGGHHGHAH